MAQLVEHLTRNEKVAGSNPATSSKKTNRCVCLFFVVGGLGFALCQYWHEPAFHR